MIKGIVLNKLHKRQCTSICQKPMYINRSFNLLKSSVEQVSRIGETSFQILGQHYRRLSEVSVSVANFGPTLALWVETYLVFKGHSCQVIDTTWSHTQAFEVQVLAAGVQKKAFETGGKARLVSCKRRVTEEIYYLFFDRRQYSLWWDSFIGFKYTQY